MVRLWTLWTGSWYIKAAHYARSPARAHTAIFARNDDGNGKARGALIGAITAKLERKDADHQMRWDLLWSDPEAQKLRHPDHADYWLWGHAFFEADMADLEHVAGLIGARR